MRAMPRAKIPRRWRSRKPAPQPVDEAVEPSELPEVAAGVGAPASEFAADEVAAESATEPETVAPARKPGRPGMSLLDFAKWDQEEPAQTANAGLAPAADEPVAAEPDTAAADVADVPVALVEMEEAAALDERAPQSAKAKAEAETPPAEQQVETAPEEPNVSRAFIERRRPDITPLRRESDAGLPVGGPSAKGRHRPVDPGEAARAGARSRRRHAALCEQRVLCADRLPVGGERRGCREAQHMVQLRKGDGPLDDHVQQPDAGKSGPELTKNSTAVMGPGSWGPNSECAAISAMKLKTSREGQ